MDLQPEPCPYRSYLLRIWHDESRNVWHASLQSTLTKRIFHFADAETMLKFLVAPSPSSSSPSTDAERLTG